MDYGKEMTPRMYICIAQDMYKKTKTNFRTFKKAKKNFYHDRIWSISSNFLMPFVACNGP